MVPSVNLREMNDECLSCKLGMVLRIVIGGGYMTAKL
jgi:hypothetical protein